jgi:pimeloyl-ACP methyl ester carboxylesterase
MQDRFVENNGVKLHYINQEGDEYTRTPLVYVPGMFGSADNLREEIPLLGARRIISLSRRGHGKSDAPHVRYGFHEFVSDIKTVIDDTHIDHLHLMAYSAGVPMALQYTLNNPDKVVSLLLLDFPARYPAYSQSWVAKTKARHEYPAHVVEAIQRDAEDIQLWSELNQITCPVRLIFGEQSQAITEQELADYKRYLPHIDIVRFRESGHQIWKPDYQRFITAINDFFNHLEKDRT